MQQNSMIMLPDCCAHENDDLTSSSYNHSVQFYEDSNHMTSSITTLSYAALQKDFAVIIVAETDFIKEVEAALKSRIKNFALLKKHGKIMLFDAFIMLNQLMVDGKPDHERFKQHIVEVLQTTKTRYKNIWVYGEMVNILLQHGDAAGALKLEALWNDLRKKIPFDLICGYQISNFKHDLEGEVFEAVCYQHSVVLPGESFLKLTEQGAQYRNVALLQQKNQALANEIVSQKELEKLLTAIVEEKTQQIYNISHEIKTPLTAIILQVTALLRMLDKGQSEDNNIIIYKLMAEIKFNTQRLNHLINNLINIKSRTP